MFNTACSV